MKNQVFVCSSLFHVFVSLAYYSKRKAGETYYLVLSNDILHTEDLKKNILQNFSIEHILIADDNAVRSELKESTFSVLRYKQLINKHLSSSLDLINKLEDSHIHLFIDCTATARYLLYNNPQATFTLLEDGAIIYLAQKPSCLSRLKTHILYGKQKFGRDTQISQIQVAKPSDVADDIRPKTVEWELTSIMKTLTEVEKTTLLNVFLSDKTFLSKRFDAIILTQPLSEDGHVTEEEKFVMYKELVSYFKLEGKSILIKTHPREKSNYQKLFPEATVIIEQFPVEILDFFPGFEIELGITIFSSAIHNIQFIKQKEEVGLAFFPKLQTAFMKVFN